MAAGLMIIVISLICAVVAITVLGGMIFQFFVTGSLFWVISQRLRQQVDQAPKPCTFCGGKIPEGAANCPQCGGPTSVVK